MSKITMIVKTRCQPGKRDEIRRLYEQHLKPRAEANPGQELIVYSYDAQDENLFYLFEIYSGQEVLQANSNATWFWEYMSAAGPLLDGQPEVMMGTPVVAKGLAV